MESSTGAEATEYAILTVFRGVLVGSPTGAVQSKVRHRVCPDGPWLCAAIFLGLCEGFGRIGGLFGCCAAVNPSDWLASGMCGQDRRARDAHRGVCSEAIAVLKVLAGFSRF